MLIQKVCGRFEAVQAGHFVATSNCAKNTALCQSHRGKIYKFKIKKANVIENVS